jgi:hypothetical protein
VKRETIADKAARLGLHVATWAPGDGRTRYRFAHAPLDYDDGTYITTLCGRGEANVWLNGYAAALKHLTVEREP